MHKIFAKILIAILIIAALIGAGFGLNYLENYEDFFYVQIDNQKISDSHGSDEMPYQYQLTGYNSDGKSKTITFNTNRHLRDGAYLKALLKATGVNRWEEVQLDDIPNPARDKLTQ